MHQTITFYCSEDISESELKAWLFTTIELSKVSFDKDGSKTLIISDVINFQQPVIIVLKSHKLRE